MTLITAFPSDYGTVIAADSQETARDAAGNEFKYSVLKLSPEPMGNFNILIAGGGNGEAIDSFIETVRRFLSRSKIGTLPELKEALQRQLKRFRHDLNSAGDDSTMHMFIAAQTANICQVWRTKAVTLNPIENPDMIGFTDQLYKYAARQLYWDNMPSIQAVLASLKVLDFAKQTCTCVDRPFSVVIVRQNGIWPVPEGLVRHYLESVTLFSAHVDRLLLACADTQMLSEDFNKQLTEFSETARHVRGDYLQEVGNLIFKQIMDPTHKGNPLSYLPPASTLTFMANGSVQVKEQGREELEQHRRILESLAAPVKNDYETRVALDQLVDRRTPVFSAQSIVTLKARRDVIYFSASENT